MSKKTKRVLNRFAFIMTMLILFTLCFGIVFTGFTIKPDLGISALSSDSFQNNNVANAANGEASGGYVTVENKNAKMNSETNINTSMYSVYTYDSFVPTSKDKKTMESTYYTNDGSSSLVKGYLKKYLDGDVNIYVTWTIKFTGQLYHALKNDAIQSIDFKLHNWSEDRKGAAGCPDSSIIINKPRSSETFAESTKLDSGNDYPSYNLTNLNDYLVYDDAAKVASVNVSWRLHRNTNAWIIAKLLTAGISIHSKDTVAPNFSVDINHMKEPNNVGTLVTFKDAESGIKSIKAHRHELKNKVYEEKEVFTLYDYPTTTIPAGTTFDISPDTKEAHWFIPRENAAKGFYKYELEDHLGNKYTIGEQTAFTGVNINFSGGYGTLESPFILANKNDFNELASLTYRGYSFQNAPYFIIDPDTQFNQNGFINLAGFDKEIGDKGKPFSGVILGGPKNGDNYTVASIRNISRPLFGWLKSQGSVVGGAKISNISIDSGTIDRDEIKVGTVLRHLESGTVDNCINNISVKGRVLVGGIVGYTTGGTISNCNNFGSIKGTVGNANDGDYKDLTRVGGIVGMANNTTISNCTNGDENNNTATINGDSNDVGGICGWGSNVAISNCSNYLEIIIGATKKCAGGIIGCASNGAQLSTNTNYGKIKGEIWAGGIVGLASGTTISSCNNHGGVTGNSAIGGISGYADASTEVNTNNNHVAISGSTDVGGIVGHLRGSSISNCNNNNTVSGTTSATGGIAGYAEGSSTLTSNTNDGNGVITGVAEVGGILGHGDTITITSCTNKGAVSATANDKGGVCGWGNAVTITQCTNEGKIEQAGDMNDDTKFLSTGGIVGYVKGSSNIKNNTNKGLVVGYISVGGIVGACDNSTIQLNINTHTNKTDEHTKGKAAVGGIVGLGINSTITGNKNINGKVHATGETIELDISFWGNKWTSAFVGGIVGANKNEENTLLNCYNSGDVIAKISSCAGGIAGSSYQVIQFCINEGNVSGSGNVGGIVGATKKNVNNCIVVGAKITQKSSQSDNHCGTIMGWHKNKYNTKFEAVNCVEVNSTRSSNGGEGKDANRKVTTMDTISGQTDKHSEHVIKGFDTLDDPQALELEEVITHNMIGLVFEYQIEDGYYFDTKLDGGAYKQPYRIKDITLKDGYATAIGTYYGTFSANGVDYLSNNLIISLAAIPTVANISRVYDGKTHNLDELGIEVKIPNYSVQLTGFYYNDSTSTQKLLRDAGDYFIDIEIHLVDNGNNNRRVGIANKSIKVTVSQKTITQDFTYKITNELTYNNTNQKPNFTLTWYDEPEFKYIWSFTYNNGYTYDLTVNSTNTSQDKAPFTIILSDSTTAGEHNRAIKLEAKPDSNFCDSIYIVFTILKKSIEGNDFIKDITEQKSKYNGKEQYLDKKISWTDGGGKTHTWTIKDGKYINSDIGGITLQDSSIISAIDAGVYQAILEANDRVGNFTGSITFTWRINRLSIKEHGTLGFIDYWYGLDHENVNNYASSQYEGDKTNIVYVGEIYNVHGKLTVSDANNLVVEVEFFGNEENGEIQGLRENDKFTITNCQKINAGTYTFTITGQGNFKGEISSEWTIKKKKISETEFSFGYLNRPNIEEQYDENGVLLLPYNFDKQGPPIRLTWKKDGEYWTDKYWSFTYNDQKYSVEGATNSTGIQFNPEDTNSFVLQVNGGQGAIDVGTYNVTIAINKDIANNNFFIEEGETLPVIEFKIVKREMSDLLILIKKGNLRIGNSAYETDADGNQYYVLSSKPKEGTLSHEYSLVNINDISKLSSSTSLGFKKPLPKGGYELKIIDNTNNIHYKSSDGSNIVLPDDKNVQLVEEFTFTANDNSGNFSGSLISSFYAMRNDFGGGTGASDNPFIISNSQEAIRLAELTNQKSFSGIEVLPWLADGAYPDGFNGYHFIVAMPSTKPSPDPLPNPLELLYREGFRPIGNDSHPFMGSFNGNNSTIYLELTDGTLDNVGLFGVFSGVELKNINIGGTITGHDYVGAVVGKLLKGNVLGNVSLMSKYKTDRVESVDGTNPLEYRYFVEEVNSGVNGNQFVGGLFGMISSTAGTTVGDNNFFGKIDANASTGKAIFNNNANVKGDGNYVGGIVGGIGEVELAQDNHKLIFEAICHNVKSVSGKVCVGGLIGYVGLNVLINLIPYNDNTNYSGVIGTDSSISGIINVGGLVGLLSGTKHNIKGAYSLNTIVGNADPNDPEKNIGNVGGLIGEMNDGTIDGCYFLHHSGVIRSDDVTIKGQNVNKAKWNYVGGIVGKMNNGKISNCLTNGFNYEDISITRGGLVGRKEGTSEINNSWTIYAVNRFDSNTNSQIPATQFTSINPNDIQYIILENDIANTINVENQIKSKKISLELNIKNSKQIVFYDLDKTEGDTGNGKFNNKLVETNEQASKKKLSRLTNNDSKTYLNLELDFSFVSTGETMELGIFEEKIVFNEIYLQDNIPRAEEFTTKYQTPVYYEDPITNQESKEYYYFTSAVVEKMTGVEGYTLTGQVNFTWKINPKTLYEIAIPNTSTPTGALQGNPSSAFDLVIEELGTIKVGTDKTWTDTFKYIIAEYQKLDPKKDLTSIYYKKTSPTEGQYYLRYYKDSVNGTYMESNVIVGREVNKRITSDPNAAYLIVDQDTWDQFANEVKSGNTFKDKVVKLSDSIVDNPNGNMTEGKIFVHNDNIVGSYNTGNRFMGTFDGNGKTIYVELDKAFDQSSNSNGLSLFPNAGGVENSPCRIMNLNIEGNVRSHVNINTDSSYDYAGNDVGGQYCAGFVSDPIGYLEITNCTNGADVYGKVDCGGIISHSNKNNNNITLIDCINAGDIMTTVDHNRHPSSGDRSRTTLHGTGGIIGFIGENQIVKLDSCKNLGNIRAASNVGGIVGVNNSELTITNSANEGNIRGQRFPEFSVNHTINRIENGITIYDYTYIEACDNMDTYIKNYHIDKVSNAGGILGSCLDKGSIKVYASFNAGDVTAGCLVAGGIVGSDTVVDTQYQTEGTIFAKSSISVDPKVVRTDIKYCYNTGTIAVGSNGKLGAKHKQNDKTKCVVNKNKDVDVRNFTCDTWLSKESCDSGALGGGIIGTSTYTNIDSCYNTGEVICNGSLNATGVTYNLGVGGILGYAFANQDNNNTTVYVKNSYSIGNIFLNFFYDYWLGILSFGHALEDRRYAAPIVGCNATSDSNTHTYVENCFGLHYSIEDPYYSNGKRWDTTEPGNADWMRTGTLLNSLADMTAVMKENGEIDAPNNVFRQDTNSMTAEELKNYKGFKNASTATLVNANGDYISIDELLGLGNVGAYIYPFGCLPQLAIFGLGTESGLSMLSTTYSKNPNPSQDKNAHDNFIGKQAGGASSPYLINDGIDLLCLEALTNATGDGCHWTGDSKYISFANGANNIYGNVAMFIDMPNDLTANRNDWFKSRDEEENTSIYEYDKRNTNRKIFTKGAVINNDFLRDKVADGDTTFNRWKANNYYFGAETVENPPVMKKGFSDAKLVGEPLGENKILSLFDDNNNTSLSLSDLTNNKFSFKVDIGRKSNLTGFSWITNNDPNTNPIAMSIYTTDSVANYNSGTFETNIYTSSISVNADRNTNVTGFNVNTSTVARYYLIEVTSNSNRFQANEFNMSFDIKLAPTTSEVYYQEPFANLIDSDLTSKFYQGDRFFKVMVRADKECYLNEIVFITGNNNSSLERVLQHLTVYGASSDSTLYNDNNYDPSAWGTAIFDQGIVMEKKDNFTCSYPINSQTLYSYYLIIGEALDKAPDDNHRGFQANDMKVKFSTDTSMIKTNMYSISKREGFGFKGVLDGSIPKTVNDRIVTKQATIEHIYMTNNKLKNLGLISVLNGGTVSNIGMTGYVKSSYISANSEDIANVGALVGLALNDSRLSNINLGNIPNEIGGIDRNLLIASSIKAENNNIGGVVGQIMFEQPSLNITINNIHISNEMISGNVGATNASNGIVGLGGVVGYVSSPATGIAPKLTLQEIQADKMIVWASTNGAHHIGGILGNHTSNLGLTFNKITLGNSSNTIAEPQIKIVGEYAVGGIVSWANNRTSLSNISVNKDVSIIRTSKDLNERKSLANHSEYGTALGGLVGYSEGATALREVIKSSANIDITGTESAITNIGGIIGIAKDKENAGVKFDVQTLDVEVNIDAQQTNNSKDKFNIGGVIGKAKNAIFNGAFNVKPNIIANQFNNVGGFIGHSEGDVYVSTKDETVDTNIITKIINIGIPEEKKAQTLAKNNSAKIVQSKLIGRENVGGFVGNNSGVIYIGTPVINGSNYFGLLQLNNYAFVDGYKSVGGIIGLNDENSSFVTGHDGSIQGLTYVTADINNFGDIGTQVDSVGSTVEGEIVSGYIGGIVGNSIGNTKVNPENNPEGNSQDLININFMKKSKLTNHSFVGIKHIDKSDIYHTNANQSRVGGIIGCTAGEIHIAGVLTNEVGGNVFGHSYVGGSIGQLVSGTITGQFENKGNVTGVEYVGGNIGEVSSRAIITNTVVGNEIQLSTFKNTLGEIDPDTNKPRGGNVSGVSIDYNAPNESKRYNIIPANKNIGGSIGAFEGTIINNGETTYAVEFNNSGNVSGYAISGGSIGHLAGRVEKAQFINSGSLTFLGDYSIGGSIGEIKDNTLNPTVMRDSRFEYVSADENRVELKAGEYIKNNPDQKSKVGGVGGVIGLIQAEQLNDTLEQGRYKWQDNYFFINGNVNAPGCINVGGVVGKIDNSYVNIKNMLAFKTTITGYDNVGGIVGFNGSSDEQKGENASLVDCYNIEGEIVVSPETQEKVNIGGIVGGHSATPTTYSCYWVKGFPNNVLERIDVSQMGTQLTSQFIVVFEGSKLTDANMYTRAKKEMDEKNKSNNNSFVVDGIYNFNAYIEAAKTKDSNVIIYDNDGNQLAANLVNNLVESNGDFGYYQQTSHSYSTGSEATGFFCVYANDADNESFNIGKINIIHTNGKDNQGIAISVDEQAWKKIAGAYSRSDESKVVESDLVYSNDISKKGIVEPRHFYATAEKTRIKESGTKGNGYFLYGAVSGQEGKVNSHDNNTYYFEVELAKEVGGKTELAENIVLFYKKIKLQQKDLKYNGLNRISPVSFNYRNKDILGRFDEPNKNEVALGDYYIKFTNPATMENSGSTVFNIQQDAMNNIGTHATIYYVNSVTKDDSGNVTGYTSVDFGEIDSGKDEEYRWNIKPRQIETVCESHPDYPTTDDGSRYTAIYDGAPHGIRFTVSGVLSDQNLTDKSVTGDGEEIQPIVQGEPLPLTGEQDVGFTSGYPKKENGKDVIIPEIYTKTYYYDYSVTNANANDSENYTFSWSATLGNNYAGVASQNIDIHIYKAMLNISAWEDVGEIHYPNKKLPSITTITDGTNTYSLTQDTNDANVYYYTIDDENQKLILRVYNSGIYGAGENEATVEVTENTLSNYTFGEENNSCYFTVLQAEITALGDIDPGTISKIYDGTTNYSGDLIGEEFDIECTVQEYDGVPVVAPNGLKFTINSITYDSKNCGTEISVTIKGETTFNDSNFYLSPEIDTNTNTTYSKIGEITQRQITIVAKDSKETDMTIGESHTYTYNGAYQGLSYLTCNEADKNGKTVDGLIDGDKLFDIIKIKDELKDEANSINTKIQLKTNKVSVVGDYSVTVEVSNIAPVNYKITNTETSNWTYNWTVGRKTITISYSGLTKYYDGKTDYKGTITPTGIVSRDEEKIEITANYYEPGDREIYSSFVNGVEKQGNSFKLNPSLPKYLKFVMVNKGADNIINNYAFEGATGDGTVLIEENSQLKILPVLVTVQYDNTFQSYVNAIGALKKPKEYSPVEASITDGLQGTDGEKVKVNVINNWLPTDPESADKDLFHEDQIIVGDEFISASLAPNNDEIGYFMNYELDTQPVLTIAYYIAGSNSSEQISSLSGLIMASYYYSLNFLSGEGLQSTKTQTMTIGYDGNSLFYYPANVTDISQATIKGTAGDVGTVGTFADNLVKHLNKSLNMGGETKIESVIMPNPTDQNLVVEYTIKFTPTPKQDFVLIKDISGIMTQDDLDVLNGRFNSDWGKGSASGVLNNLKKVNVGENIVIYDALFKDTFVGKFDGNNYVIKDLIIQNSSNGAANIGLFSRLAKTIKVNEEKNVSGDGIITSLHLRNVNIRIISNKNINVGGIIGEAENVDTLANLSFVGDVRVNTTGTLNYGGIIGQSITTGQSANGLQINNALVLGRVRTNSIAGSNIGSIAGKMASGGLTDVLEMVELIHTGKSSNVNIFEGSGVVKPTKGTYILTTKGTSMINNGNTVVNVVEEGNGNSVVGKTYDEMRAASTHIDYTVWAGGTVPELKGSDVLVLAQYDRDTENGRPGYPRQSTTFRDIVDVYLLNFKLIEEEITPTEGGNASTTQGETPATPNVSATNKLYNYKFGDSDWVTVETNNGQTIEYININNRQKLALVKLLWFANFKVTVDIEITSDDIEFKAPINEVFVGKIESVETAKITHFNGELFAHNNGITTGIQSAA